MAEDLVRLRRPDEQRRYASCQRQGRIDPNPHQIDAVVFALRRIPEGGCILADEVGLGKTIEAGLIMSQLIAEGMRRVLLIVPKSLLGQWQTELYTLFGIETKEGRVDPDAFAGNGVFLAHRELAGGVKGASVLKAVDPFDLVVVDEAHEVFSSVYKRFDKEGFYDDDSKHAQTAGRVREVVKRGGSPVLLLTATPIQNSLAELWGLVQYVEPTGTLLGRLPTFREVFCDTGDRSVLPEQAVELKRRLQTVLQRTLRRQAQEFLEVPFVERRARVFEYEMSEAEKALYDDVTAWLMREQLFSFTGSQRHLLLILFHRRMASSLEALAVSLRHVAARLRERLATRGYLVADDGELVLRELSDDFEGNLEPETKDDGDEAEPEAPANQEPPKVSATTKGILAELEEVEGFAARASGLTRDSKARRLLDALRIVRERGEQGSGSGKAVIFTEALSTQDYLKRLLIAEGYQAEDVTLFRGSNKGPEAERALARWEAEIGNAIPAAHRPSREIAVRLALVHEFASRSKVFISTEAGAKGLNLQFCDTIINYDLPWNPQRIEQRIGRVHRYGQKRGVTVISFLAAGNEAQRLTLDILTQKLDLFGRVLDLSDAILYEPSRTAPESLVASVGVDFERELRSIYSRARSIDDVAADLRHLRSTMEERRQAFDDEQERTSDLVESRLDDAVRLVFAKYRSELPAELDGLDRDVDRITSAFLESSRTSYQRSQQPGRVEYRIQPSGAMPDGYREGFVAVIGDSREISEGEALHVGHPVVQAAIDDARRRTSAPMRVVFGPLNGATAVSALAGRRGRLVVTKVSYRGIEPADSLLTTAVMDGSPEPLEPSVLDLLLALPARETDQPVDTVGAAELQDAVDEAVFRDQATVSATEQARFDQMLRQLDHYLSDQVLVWRRKRAKVDDEIEELTKRLSKTLSAQAKADQEGRLRSLTKQAADIGSQIDKLENGGDADYQEWRERLFGRRFRPAEVTRLLDVQFEIEAGDRAC